MNSIIGKTAFAAAILLLTASGFAAEKVLYSDDFESVLPGRDPLKWRRAWGSQADDLLYVTSERSVSGKNSMMIEHFESPGQWGAGFRLPSPKKGMQTIELAFSIDGPANQTHISFEIRDGKNAGLRLLCTGFKRQILSIYSTKKDKVEKRNGVFGHVSNDRWYKLVFTFPLTPADGDTAKGELTDLSSGKKMTAETAFLHPTDGVGSLYLNIPPQTKNYKVFIDDFRVTVRE